MKKLFSLVLSAVLVFALCGSFVLAEGEINADGYEFKVDHVNGVIAAEQGTIVTNQDAVATANLKWTINILLEKVADNLYKSVGAPITGTGAAPEITLGENQILLGIHSSTSDPAQVEEYANVIGKLTAMAVTDGMYFQLVNIDLSATGNTTDGKAICTAADPRASDTSSEEAVETSSEAPTVSSEATASSSTPATSDSGATALIIIAIVAIAVTALIIKKRA